MEESVLAGKQFGFGHVKVEVMVKRSHGNAYKGENSE